MPLKAQVITNSYSNIAQPSNPFTQINLEPNKDVGTTSYDNAEMVETLSKVYTYAQQQQSILMPLFDKTSMSAMFHSQDTFNKVQFVQKVEEAPYTPLYVPSGGTRSYTLLQFHQGMQIPQTTSGMRRYAVTPKFQMQLSYAMGRLYDLGIIWALTQPVLSKSSVSAATFKGIPSTSVVNLPNSSVWLHGTVSGGAWQWSDITVDLFDRIALHFENLSIDTMANLWVVGGPRLRKGLKKLTAFNNKETTLVYQGNRNSRYLSWNDFNFAFLGPETKPNNTYNISASTQGTVDGGTPVASGGTAIGAANLTADKVDSFIVVDFSTLTWGPAPYATRAFTSLRDDRSYTPQFYTEFGFGGMRLDDAKVLVVHYKRAK